jgi:BspA type Leucine rich repeat region (6 copies)
MHTIHVPSGEGDPGDFNWSFTQWLLSSKRFLLDTNRVHRSFKATIFSFILVAIFVPSAKADSLTFACGAGSYQVVMPAGVAVNGSSCTGDLTLDSSVKIIYESAFQNARISNLNIPSTVTSIGTMAFFMDESLCTVVIPDSVTFIGNGAFNSSCLKTLTLSKSVKTILYGTFAYTQLTSLSIPDGVESIEPGAFHNTPIASVTFPKSMTTVGGFGDTKISNVNIPSTATGIGASAFANTPLNSVYIPNSVNSIGDSAFFQSKLTNVLLPNSVLSVGIGAFAFTPLTSVTIPNSVTVIGQQAFLSTLLNSVVIPNSVRRIENQTFANDLALTSISLPDDLQYIDPTAFAGDLSLNKIEYCGKLQGLPIIPICPPERQAAADKAAADKAAADKAAADKAAADKAAADKAAADKAAVSLKEQNDNLIQKAKNFVSSANIFLAQNARWGQTNTAISVPFGVVNYYVNIFGDILQAYEATQILTPEQVSKIYLGLSVGTTDLQLASSRIATYVTTITCIKGSKFQKVTGYKPTCPAGYKKK